MVGSHEIVPVTTQSEKVSTPEKNFDLLETELESMLQKNPILQVGDSMSHSKKRKLLEFKQHDVIHISQEEGDSDLEIQGFSGEEEGDEEEEEEERPLASRRALPKRQLKLKEELKSKRVKAPPQKEAKGLQGQGQSRGTQGPSEKRNPRATNLG